MWSQQSVQWAAMLRCASVWLCLCLLGLAEEAQYLDLFEGDNCEGANGEIWTCKSMDDCPKFQEDWKKNIRPKYTCAIVDNKQLICCEPMIKKSKKMCEKYGESVFFPVIDPYTGKPKKEASCANLDPLISGGRNAQPQEYPHMALIGYEIEGKIVWNCGGSLISERYILSAAHCTDGGRFMGLAKWVRLGDYKIKSMDDDNASLAQSRNYEILEIINHPNYKSEYYYNDIALYKLNATVEFNEFIRPICLNTDDQLIGRTAVATGWGKTMTSGPRPEILQEVNVTITTIANCSKYFQEKGSLKFGLDEETMMCAGNWNNEGDTCQGDSGGPLQMHLEKPFCMYTQIGVTSFGRYCGIRTPGVYTKVSRFVEWIEGIVWP